MESPYNITTTTTKKKNRQTIYMCTCDSICMSFVLCVSVLTVMDLQTFQGAPCLSSNDHWTKTANAKEAKLPPSTKAKLL